MFIWFPSVFLSVVAAVLWKTWRKIKFYLYCFSLLLFSNHFFFITHERIPVWYVEQRTVYMAAWKLLYYILDVVENHFHDPFIRIVIVKVQIAVQTN